MTELYLQENKIASIYGDIFFNNLDLKILDLSANLITTLPNFTGLVSVQSMNFSDNRITTIRNHSFVGLISLTNLRLDKNLIDNIEYKAFYGLISLLELNLNDNKLNSTSWHLKNLTTLRQLRLNKNKITEYPYFEGNNTVLRKLFLADNLIREIRNDTYEQFLTLQILDLGSNLLTDFPIEIIENIKVSVYLSHYVTFKIKLC